MNKSLPREKRPGGFFDVSTVKGNVRSVVVVLVCCSVIWNFHYISFWLNSVFGFEHVPASESMIHVRRFWAGLAAGTMVLAGGGNILWLYLYRKQAIKSAEGQWYDKLSLNKEDLYADDEGDPPTGKKEGDGLGGKGD